MWPILLQRSKAYNAFLTIAVLLCVARASESVAHQECGVYLAESTIPNAGLGMFAGNKPYQKDEYVSFGDIVIPVSELEWHLSTKDFHFLWAEYAWNPSTFDQMEFEVDDPEALYACSTGFGAAINCILPLVNGYNEEETTPDSAGISSQDPGAGAFTPFHGRRFAANQRIEPGTELFADYGENYFTTRHSYRHIPVFKSYEKADKLVNAFQELIEDTVAESPLNETVLSSLWSVIKEFPGMSAESLRVFSALPDNATDIPQIMETGGTSHQFYNRSIRSLEWLEEHGQCMDNIKDGISTIPSAGRGAFANRRISKGGLVAPLPLIQVHREIMTMYEADPKSGGRVRDPSRPNHNQLMLNYCFGHRQSSVLLCPYGLLTSLINHSKEPNAELVWSNATRRPEWFDQSFDEWATFSAGLAFDAIALRDIEEDEEVTISYGTEWEEAWQEHVLGFVAPRPFYEPAYELNKAIDLRIRTVDEWSYEDNQLMYCRGSIISNSGVVLKQSPVKRVEGESLYYCQAQHRWDDDNYIAEIVSWTEQDGIKVEAVVVRAPRDIFVFEDTPYSRDHHQEWSFRHDMRIPDEMFPPAWKDPIPENNSSHTMSRSRADSVCLDGAQYEEVVPVNAAWA